MATVMQPNMRAWYHDGRGQPTEVLKFTTDFVTPRFSDLAPDEILVKVSYCALTPGVSMMMPLEPAWLHKMPAIPELEFSGTVIALGTDAEATRPDLAVDTPVIVFVPMQRLITKPKDMSFAESAALGGNGITAIQALELSNLKKGDKILINGGSGGTGSMMIQCAKDIVGDSGYIATTGSMVNSDMLRELGADEVIDYQRHDPLHAYLEEEHSQSPFNAIVDTIGIQSLYACCPRYLSKNGRFINIGAMKVQPTLLSVIGFFWCQLFNAYWPAFLGGTPRWFRMLSGSPDFVTLSKVKEMAERGSLKSVIDSIWEMQDAIMAYQRIESKHSKGKVLIRIAD
ncbi:Zinc alcohol dehydrogenase [Penicillium hetheringtonii]|uniref:Zinc alcohol dehydrogenase n=1 Tax=Penicillium hetheringtonii TaxID=911720 RepID=A0AAD6GT32_9EURO|nr:Zinc alcohol dehydrogenase [Penicillium hetheringtonii]